MCAMSGEVPTSKLEPAPNLLAFLQLAKLEHLSPTLAARSLESLGVALLKLGRINLLRELKELGVSKLAERQALANGLTRAIREGLLTKQGCIPADFSVQAERMPSVVRRLLVEGVEPSSVPLAELLFSLSIARSNPALADAASCDVERVVHVIDAGACERLRKAVDSERSTVSQGLLVRQ